MKTCSRRFDARLILKVYLSGLVGLVLYAGLMACNSNDNNPAPAAPPVTPASSPSPTPSPSPSASPSPLNPVAVGRWGGPHIQMDVRAQKGAVIQFECATGTTDQPLETDPNGDFQGAGIYNVTSGPIVLGQPRSFQATYYGNVDGDFMQLTVQYTDASGQLVTQDFQLIFENESSFDEACAD